MILSPTSLRPLIRFNNPLKNALEHQLQGVFVVSKNIKQKENAFLLRHSVRLIYNSFVHFV